MLLSSLLVISPSSCNLPVSMARILGLLWAFMCRENELWQPPRLSPPLYHPQGLSSRPVTRDSPGPGPKCLLPGGRRGGERHTVCKARCQGKREVLVLWGSTCPSFKQEKDFNLRPKQVGLKPGHSSESPGERVRMQIARPPCRGLGLMDMRWVGPGNVQFPDADFASSQVRLMLLVWGPHFANHCPKWS